MRQGARGGGAASAVRWAGSPRNWLAQPPSADSRSPFSCAGEFRIALSLCCVRSGPTTMSAKLRRRWAPLLLLAIAPSFLANAALPSSSPHSYAGQPAGDYSSEWQQCRFWSSSPHGPLISHQTSSSPIARCRASTRTLHSAAHTRATSACSAQATRTIRSSSGRWSMRRARSRAEIAVSHGRCGCRAGACVPLCSVCCSR